MKRCEEYIEKIGSLERVISSEIIVKGSCTAIADENLNLIFENLIDNAVRHSGTERIEVLLSEIGSEAESRVVD